MCLLVVPADRCGGPPTCLRFSPSTLGSRLLALETRNHSLKPKPTAESPEPRALLSDYIDAHRTGRPLDGVDRRFDRVAVQIGHLHPGDVFNLLRRNRANLVAVRLGGTLREIGHLLQQHRGRWSLEDE